MYKASIFLSGLFSSCARSSLPFPVNLCFLPQLLFKVLYATNQHFKRLLGKRSACLTVCSRKWTHTDFSLQAQREIWSCSLLISRTTEFEGKQAAFRLRTMLYCSGGCTQLIVQIPVLQAWHVLHEWARLFRHQPRFLFLRTANRFSICNTTT